MLRQVEIFPFDQHQHLRHAAWIDQERAQHSLLRFQAKWHFYAVKAGKRIDFIHADHHSFLTPGCVMVQFLKSQKFGQNLCLKSRKQSAKEGAFKLYFLPCQSLRVYSPTIT